MTVSAGRASLSVWTETLLQFCAAAVEVVGGTEVSPVVEPTSLALLEGRVVPVPLSSSSVEAAGRL